ncbi:unnamed protein product, partial [Prorocentrum cordatum]
SLSSLFSYDHCRPSPPPPLLPPVLIGAMGSRPAPPGGACQCSDRSRRCIGLAAAAAWIAAALCWSVVRFPSAADLLGRQAAAPAAEAAPPTAEALGSVAAAAAAEAADLGAGSVATERNPPDPSFTSDPWGGLAFSCARRGLGADSTRMR